MKYRIHKGGSKDELLARLTTDEDGDLRLQMMDNDDLDWKNVIYITRDGRLNRFICLEDEKVNGLEYGEDERIVMED